MKPSTLPRCKIPQIPNPVLERVKTELAKFGLYACILAAAGWLTLQPIADSALARMQVQAQVQALAQFESGWKSQLINNSTLLNAACRTWYFGMNAKERTLK